MMLVLVFHFFNISVTSTHCLTLIIIKMKNPFTMSINTPSSLLFRRLIIPHTVSMRVRGLVGVETSKCLVDSITTFGDIVGGFGERGRVGAEVVVFTTRRLISESIERVLEVFLYMDGYAEIF